MAETDPTLIEIEICAHIAQSAALDNLRGATRDEMFSRAVESADSDFSTVAVDEEDDGHFPTAAATYYRRQMKEVARSMHEATRESQLRNRMYVAEGASGSAADASAPTAGALVDTPVSQCREAIDTGTKGIDLLRWRAQREDMQFEHELEKAYISQLVDSRGAMTPSPNRALTVEAFKPSKPAETLHLRVRLSLLDNGDTCLHSNVVLNDRRSIIDTGTTITIAKDSTPLSDFDTNSSVLIAGFNGSVSRSSGEGTIVGYTRNNQGRKVGLRIKQAHRVSGAPNDLISVSSLTANKYEFHFLPTHAYIVTPEKEILDLVLSQGLYWLEWQCAGATPQFEVCDVALSELHSPPFHFGSIINRKQTCTEFSCEHCNLAAPQTVDLRLIHRRFGHVGQNLIRKMCQDGALNFKLSDDTTYTCDTCDACKLTRRHVPSERENEPLEWEPFERIWTDVKGKVEPDLWGNRYLVVFICEATRWISVYFTRRKSLVKRVFKEFITWVISQGYKVKLLNSDGGGEYTANENAVNLSEFQQLCKEYGIQQQFTSPKTSAQNGISERHIRTIFTGAKCLLHEACLGNKFWSFAVKHYVYVKNRIWHSAVQIDGKPASSFERLHGRKPNLDMVRVFGADSRVLDFSVAKGDPSTPRGRKAIYLGISSNRKGWVFFDPVTRKLFTSYHCVFDESLQGRRNALLDAKRTTKNASRQDELTEEYFDLSAHDIQIQDEESEPEEQNFEDDVSANENSGAQQEAYLQPDDQSVDNQPQPQPQNPVDGNNSPTTDTLTPP